MIFKNFEFKFIMKFILIALVGIGIQALALYFTFPKSETQQYGEAIELFSNADSVLRSSMMTAFIIESIILPILVILAAVFASHKIAGPLFRIHKSLDEPVTSMSISPIKLRTNDQLQDTARSFNTMLEGISERFNAISIAVREVNEASKSLDDRSGSIEKLREKVDNLGNSIEKFRL